MRKPSEFMNLKKRLGLGNTLKVLKSFNLLHKQGFVDSQSLSIVQYTSHKGISKNSFAINNTHKIKQCNVYLNMGKKPQGVRKKYLSQNITFGICWFVCHINIELDLPAYTNGFKRSHPKVLPTTKRLDMAFSTIRL